ncbi:MAG: AraC family transcriptional regulator [Balneola sp.]|nr:AraC family transcriptional regulator [Balneola sp.]
MYIRSFIKGCDLDRRDLIHTIPFVFHLFMLVPYYVLDGGTKIEMLLNRQVFLFENELIQTLFLNIAYVLPIVMTLHLGIYTILGYKLISEKDLSNVKESTERWLTILRYSFIGFTVSFASYYVMVYLFSYGLAYDYAISVAMSVFIYAIGYFGFISPEVLEGDIKSHTEKGKYSNSGLTESTAENLKEQLIKLMENDKLFLKSNLKLKDLANAVGESKHHVSQVINDELETTFSAFVNEYRIKESQELLLNKTDELNMYGIAKESGFNNKTTFSLAFKRHTGLTPSLYQKKFQDSK